MRFNKLLKAALSTSAVADSTLLLCAYPRGREWVGRPCACTGTIRNKIYDGRTERVQ